MHLTCDSKPNQVNQLTIAGYCSYCSHILFLHLHMHVRFIVETCEPHPIYIGNTFHIQVRYMYKRDRLHRSCLGSRRSWHAEHITKSLTQRSWSIHALQGSGCGTLKFRQYCCLNRCQHICGFCAGWCGRHCRNACATLKLYLHG